MTSRRAAFVVVSVAFGLAAATGCGGSGSSEEASGTVAVTATPDAPEGLPGTYPLGLTSEQYAANVEESQALIATCMEEAGFEYVPAPLADVAVAEHADRVQPGFTREEYKRAWGYGVSTRFDNLPREIELGRQNLSYIEGLSEQDRAAYERTLWGDDPNETFAFALSDEDFSGVGGCTREAVEQVFTPEQIRGDYVNPKDILIEKDPRVAKANADWVTCMEDAGYEGYLDQDEIIEDFEERFDALTSDEEAPTLSGPRLAQLQELQREEIAAAMADHECDQKHTTQITRRVEEEVYGFTVSGRRDVELSRDACPSCDVEPPPAAGGRKP